MRLNKFLSHHGICSRRDADILIKEGRIRVNQNIMQTPYIVQQDDKVYVDGVLISEKPTPKVWIYHKPKGLVTSHKDEQGRPTVFNQENVKRLGRVISVGRLDLNSEGLLLLTNNPDFAHEAEHPKNEWKRIYKVRVFGNVNYPELDNLKNGITIDGVHYNSVDIEYDKPSNSLNQWLLVTLVEGKNREIRKIFNHLGLQVNRLIRLSYGPYQLGNLKLGDLKLADKELKAKA